MKKSAHAYSALIQSGQFRARIARKECGHFNEVGRKKFIKQSANLFFFIANKFIYFLESCHMKFFNFFLLFENTVFEKNPNSQKFKPWKFSHPENSWV